MIWNSLKKSSVFTDVTENVSFHMIKPCVVPYTTSTKLAISFSSLQWWILSSQSGVLTSSLPVSTTTDASSSWSLCRWHIHRSLKWGSGWFIWCLCCETEHHIICGVATNKCVVPWQFLSRCSQVEVYEPNSSMSAECVFWSILSVNEIRPDRDKKVRAFNNSGRRRIYMHASNACHIRIKHKRTKGTQVNRPPPVTPGKENVNDDLSFPLEIVPECQIYLGVSQLVRETHKHLQLYTPSDCLPSPPPATHKPTQQTSLSMCCRPYGIA